MFTWNRSSRRGVLAASLVALVLLGPWSTGYGQALAPELDPDTGFLAWHELDLIPGRHVEGEVLYAQIPPVGGPHSPVWQNCGSYSQPIYNWHAVHALEHGAVWITYDPDLPPADIAQLESLVAMGHVIVSPYPGLPDPVVASAWGRQARLSGAGDPLLMQFIRDFRMSPDTSPEPGAICTLGTDLTMPGGETPQLEPAVVSGTPDEVAAAGGAKPTPGIDIREPIKDRD